MKKVIAVSLIIFILLSQFTTAGSGELDVYGCGGYTPISGLLGRTNLTAYSDWIKQLSGDTPVKIASQPFTIATRFTSAMFNTQQENAKAFQFVEQQVRRWYSNSQVWIHEYPMWGFTAKNLVLELPGTVFPNEVVILSAHLDSTSIQSSYSYAPGADDNATGSAALLEAARLLRNYRFKRTIRLIWFTGEEQGLYGSNYYTIDPAVNLSQIVGVINMDMFGYDKNDDHCFELHVGILPKSDIVGQCFTNTISAYGLDLTYDYITDGASSASDHRPFWDAGVGAVEVLENHDTNNLPGGCSSSDWNPYYHKVTDTLANMNPAYAFEIAKAGMASAANLAGPLDVCLGGAAPLFTDAQVAPGTITLSWDAVPSTTSYRIFRSSQSCGGEIDQTSDAISSPWVARYLVNGRVYHYWVEGVSSTGCFSLASGCASLTAEAFSMFVPWVSK